jgi:hypothetical protein
MIRVGWAGFLMSKRTPGTCRAEDAHQLEGFLCRVFPPAAKDRNKAGSERGIGFNWYLDGMPPDDRVAAFRGKSLG